MNCSELGPLHINVLTWDAVVESVEGRQYNLPLAGGKVGREAGGKGRLIASLAANPSAVEGVFVRGREFCHVVGASTRCDHADCAPFNPDPHKVMRIVTRHLLCYVRRTPQQIFSSKW